MPLFDWYIKLISSTLYFLSNDFFHGWIKLLIFEAVECSASLPLGLHTVEVSKAGVIDCLWDCYSPLGVILSPPPTIGIIKVDSLYDWCRVRGRIIPTPSTQYFTFLLSYPRLHQNIRLQHSHKPIFKYRTILFFVPVFENGFDVLLTQFNTRIFKQFCIARKIP